MFHSQLHHPPLFVWRWWEQECPFFWQANNTLQGTLTALSGLVSFAWIWISHHGTPIRQTQGCCQSMAPAWQYFHWLDCSSVFECQDSHFFVANKKRVFDSRQLCPLVLTRILPSLIVNTDMFLNGMESLDGEIKGQLFLKLSTSFCEPAACWSSTRVPMIKA